MGHLLGALPLSLQIIEPGSIPPRRQSENENQNADEQCGAEGGIVQLYLLPKDSGPAQDERNGEANQKQAPGDHAAGAITRDLCGQPVIRTCSDDPQAQNKERECSRQSDAGITSDTK